MIPDKAKKEWAELISNNNEVQIQSFSLKMKVNNLRKAFEFNMMSLNEAVDDLHKTCEKYEKLYKSDLEKIFNS